MQLKRMTKEDPTNVMMGTGDCPRVGACRQEIPPGGVESGDGACAVKDWPSQ